MSDNRSQRGSGRQYRSADDIVRSILDDRASTSDVSPSGELYRAIERYHSTPSAPDSSMTSDPNRDLQRRFSREPRSRNSQPSDSLPGPPAGPPPLPPLRSLHRRNSGMSAPGGIGGGRLTRHRSGGRYHQEAHRASIEHRAPSFEDLEHNLEDANSHLRALLDFTNNDPIIPPLSPPFASPSYPQDPAEDSRRIKRRKLDSDRLAPSFKGFRYGRYGQVEPGQLTMEMVSCDGGIYHEGSTYAAENILKDDSSVYCTKGNRCNIVLRHQGATAFTLKELVIKAPGRSFSSPVREGMVFISMAKDELLQRTAQYQIQYVVGTRLPGRPGMERETRPLAPIISIRHNHDGTVMSRAQVRQRRLYSIGMDDVDINGSGFGRAQIPSEFAVNPPQFRVTTECADDEGDDAPNPRPRRRTPNRIGALPFESDSGDEWGQAEDHRLEELAVIPYPRMDENMTLAEAVEASQLATQEAVRAVGGDLMAPHAKFHIDKGKNKCTIHFDPPVSGRFILLKMWNPQPDPLGNIDIQGVVARGFAGPRYFPALELR